MPLIPYPAHTDQTVISTWSNVAPTVAYKGISTHPAAYHLIVTCSHLHSDARPIHVTHTMHTHTHTPHTVHTYPHPTTHPHPHPTTHPDPHPHTHRFRPAKTAKVVMSVSWFSSNQSFSKQGNRTNKSDWPSLHSSKAVREKEKGEGKEDPEENTAHTQI